MKLGRILLVLVIVGIGFYMSRRSNAAIAFNDALVELLRTSNDSFSHFTEEVTNYYEGNDPNIALMRAEIEDIREVSERNIQEARALKRAGGDSGDAFRESVIACLEQNQAWADSYAEIVDHIEANQPATEADVEFINRKLEVLTEKDSILMASLEEVQKAFAKDYKFDLK